MTATSTVSTPLPEQVQAHLTSGRPIVSDDLASLRPVVLAELLAERLTVIWVSLDAALAPEGSVHLDPTEAIDEDVLDQLEDSWCAARTAVVMDSDALNNCGTYDRLHLTGQAKKAHRFLRLHAA